MTHAQSHRIAYVVPTKDRPEDLRKMLQSVSRQTFRPHQIVVVDGSGEAIAPEIRAIVGSFGNLPVEYVRVFPPGLARQRNAGIARIRDDITLAGYLDDDLVLEPDATERMMAFWSTASEDTGGAAFSVINQPNARSPGLASLFLLNDRRPGRMLRSGFHTQIPFITTLLETDWLYGGGTIWRREVIAEFSYDEWYVGTGYLEDVDYSFRVRQKYRLFLVGDARLNHYSHPVALDRNYVLGRQQVVNRVYFVRKMGTFSNAAFGWALFGQFVHNMAATVTRRDSAGVRRAAGNVSGLAEVLLRGVRQVHGHFK